MSSQESIYLDFAATTPIDPRVLEAMNNSFQQYGNSESVHDFGFKSHEQLQMSRKMFAESMNVHPREIIFTSGGTESDNIATLGVTRKFMRDNPGVRPHIITSAIEHHAIWKSCEYLEKLGVNVTYVPVESDGIVAVKKIQESITKNTILITIMHVNNELGTIQPIKEIGKLAKDENILFHSDTVQSFGKIYIDPNEMKLDMLSASAHKLYGPKGIGLLYIKNSGRRTPIDDWNEQEPDEEDFFLEPIMFGGGQENKLRPATVNVQSIVGFAKAYEIMEEVRNEEMNRLREFQQELTGFVLSTIPDSRLNGHPNNRLASHNNFSFKNVNGFDLLTELDQRKIAVSTGSACIAQSDEVSHVIEALRLPSEYQQGTLRISTGRYTTSDHIKRIKIALEESVNKLRK
ncbi:MAG: cysteine desulfurase [Candidatus Lokiarchaeota archaeon]|nr:cysteine desulfurase [Candidatus Lokiarchaeota archaeon]